MKFDTLAVHAGAEPDAQTGALAPPLHLSTTFEHAPDGSLPHGLLYQRYENPTQQRFQDALCALEGGERALFFSTGMAAGTALLQSLPPGAHVLMQDDIYHGYRAAAREYLSQWGYTFSTVDTTQPDAVRAALSDGTSLLWIETPSNPLLKVVDIAAMAQLAHTVGAKVLVDGTFATPCLQRPLQLGADIVLHSTTKYLGGHSDVMGGALIFARDDELAARCFETRKLLGASASPLSAWLSLRGLRSLPARMRMHCGNAMQLATFLAAHPAIEAVHYPGLPSHSGHKLAQEQMRGFGGMLSVQVRGGRETTLAVAGKLKVFYNATSLGGCESLVEHRASVEGAHPVSPQNLLRLSVGLEDVEDLIADWKQALEM
ncbi:MAG TPA: aminotransferase class V-fold PLP-dependent enzyme [Rhodanobacteraceae bacterium]|nr:aminotransferase class V-fold PLP-dependent enzyme [Rhodanobacteraceae bacterium]